MSETRWWASLRHGGLLIAPSRVADRDLFPAELPPLDTFTIERLRREWLRLRSKDQNHELIDIVLEWVCGLKSAYGRKWVRGSDIDTSWSRRALTGEVIRPRRLWLAERNTVLPVFVDAEARLGVGRGRRAVARVVEWLRATSHKLALVTNGRQFRLLYAGSDYEAWCEWDAALWFEDGTPGPQVDAFRALLSVDTLVPQKEGDAPVLLRAIDLSRKGQAELSEVLGERVRKAVELLLQAHGKALDDQLANVPPRDIYRAAARIVMRLVVAFFAEARDLLPRDNPLYHESYGLSGLREQLGPFAAGERLRHRYGAYSRILALFRLIYDGSHHEALPVMRYGGGLFTPGSASSSDPVSLALATFERGNHDVTDDVVASILDLLCTTRVRVRQGRSTTWVTAPVDFSDLSSEYIGILYEGLLDYELKRCADDDPTIFLALGTQPALPLSRLEGMDDEALRHLVDALKKNEKSSAEEGGEEEGESEEDEGEAEEGDDDTTDESEDDVGEQSTPEAESGSLRADARRRANAWARRAAVVGGLVSRRRRRSGEDDAELDAAAERLVRDVMVPGQWFLVRWGGTRKGHGTFYTRPQLTVPIVQRTLRPLAFDAPLGDDGKPNELAPPAEWTPKSPADILSLTVCDPAMGSGSFLVAALRFLTDALFASLHRNACIAPQGDGALVTLPFGDAAAGKLSDLLLPLRPDADDFELRLRARLKRFVLERCLYGVDIDPLAVELARLSLWVETMDRDMPFEFLRHKFKNGNSIIGCWFDRHRDYPALAWMREGGDKDREGVHHEKGKWTRAISQMKDRVRESLVDMLTNQLSLLDRQSGDAEGVHDTVANALLALHQPPLADPEDQERRYRESVETRDDFERLRSAFDTWCAVWFWPADQLDLCPLAQDLLTPSDEARAVVRHLQAHHRFFHWDIEFPDVFAGAASGFDAVVGNPPWEIQKPSSLEFFSNLDPLYRSYTKTEAVVRQRELFAASESDEKAWVAYNAELKAKSNWVKNVGNPWGDGAGDTDRFSLGRGRAAGALHDRWASVRSRRRAYADASHPYRYQGSGDINTYKLFLEQSHALLRGGGRLGMLVPSGIYSDLGARDLRVLFLERCRWDWLYAFQNERFVFENVHHAFKVAAIGFEKGSHTTAILTRFRLGPGRSPEASELEVDINDAPSFLRVPTEQIARFSPESRALIEVADERDLELFARTYGNAPLLGAADTNGWHAVYGTEFHMSADSRLFPQRGSWEDAGFRPDEYGRWVGESGEVALPLFQGVALHHFDVAAKVWVRGTAARARWEEQEPEGRVISPHFLMGQHDYAGASVCHGWKLAFRAIAPSTNSRTFISSILQDWPTGHSLSVLVTDPHAPAGAAALSSVMNSFVYDYFLRQRLVGSNLSWFVLADTVVPKIARRRVRELLSCYAVRLTATHLGFAPTWMMCPGLPRGLAWRRLWAITAPERLRLRAAVDAAVAALYGLDSNGLRWILRDCDHPVHRISDKPFSRKLDPKGFWRVDKHLDPELRLSVLVHVALHELQEVIRQVDGDIERGVEMFLISNGGDGWMLPETLRLADYGLGHDDRAMEPQPLASRLGPRFYPWQLEQSAEESWTECERHAHAILGDAAFERLKAGGASEEPYASATRGGAGGESGGPTPAQGSLFAAAATAPTGLIPPRGRGAKRRT